MSVGKTIFKIKKSLNKEARHLGEHKSDHEDVTTALTEYVARLRQRRILKAFGTVDFDPEYDYKAERRRKRNS